MIPNPKKQITVNFNIEQVNLAFSKIPKINEKYKLHNHNAVMNILTLSAFELLSLGVYIDLSAKMLSSDQTEITIEVRRKIGAFDEWYEVGNANSHIEILLSDISDLLTNPDIEKSTAQTKAKKIETDNKNVISSVLGWGLGILILLAAFKSTMPIVNILLFLLLINKSIRRLFKS